MCGKSSHRLPKRAGLEFVTYSISFSVYRHDQIVDATTGNQEICGRWWESFSRLLVSLSYNDCVVAVFALSQVAFYFAFKWVVGSLDPNKAKRQEAKSKSTKVLGRLGVSEIYADLSASILSKVPPVIVDQGP